MWGEAGEEKPSQNSLQHQAEGRGLKVGQEIGRGGTPTPRMEPGGGGGARGVGSGLNGREINRGSTARLEERWSCVPKPSVGHAPGKERELGVTQPFMPPFLF